MKRYQRLILATAACLGVLGVAGSARAEPSKTGYQRLGGQIKGSPAVVSWAANRLDLFVVATNGALYHKAWDGANWYPAQDGPWEWLGGAIVGSPTAVSWGTNRLDI